MIEFLNVSKQYFGYEPFINDFNLKIEKGEKVVLFGVTGSGKTTILKMLAGLIDVTDGEIIHNGKNIKEIRLKDRNTAMVFEDLAIPKYKTGLKILSRPMILRGLNRNEARKRAVETALKYDIAPLLDNVGILIKISEKVKLAIVRGVMRNAGLTLIDNPLKLMSILERREYIVNLTEMINSLDGTVIYATDNIEELKYFKGRIIFLSNGYIKQTGSYKELINNPSSLYVARLMHPDINFINGRLSGSKISLLKREYVIKDYNLKGEKDVILGIPPKNVILKDDGIPCSLIYRRGDGISVLRAEDTIIKAETDGNAASVDFDLSGVTMFDAEDEKRLFLGDTL